MTYKEQLRKFNQTDLNLFKVEVASELAAHTELTLTDDAFEIVCKEIYDWFLHTTNRIKDLADGFVNALLHGALTVKDIERDSEKVRQVMNIRLCTLA